MKDSNNMFSQYYKSASNCGSGICFSNTKPFDINTHIVDLPFANGLITGASENITKASSVGGDIHGLRFQEDTDSAKIKNKPYEYTVHQIAEAPWRGACNESTFMNRTKEDNERLLQPNKQCKVLPIITQKQTNINEGFGENTNNLTIVLLLAVLFICMNK